MTEAERITLLVNLLEGGNASEFARKIGISKASASKLKSGVVSIRLHINSILAVYPDVDRTWLETGEGHPGDLTPDLVKARYEERLRRADRIIDNLTKRIDELEQKLAVQNPCLK